MLTRYIFLFLLLAYPLDGAASPFPYDDPFYSTLTFALLKADDRAPISYIDLPLRPLPERDQVPFYGASRNKVKVRLWPAAQSSAPLVVIVPGVGSDAGAGYSDFLAGKLHKQGQHVLVLPSPFHFTFALAASRSGFPGLTREDALDLYALTKLAMKAGEARGLNFTRTSVLGFSMGALEAGFLAVLDRQNRQAPQIGFQRVLLVNPPVDPLFSIDALDRLSKAGDHIPEAQKKQLHQRALEFGMDALHRDINQPGYFANLPARFPTTLEERQYLIGSNMRNFLPSLIFTTQQVLDLGVFHAPQDEFDSVPRLREAEQFSIGDYIEKFLIPGLIRHRGGISLDPAELERGGKLSGIANELHGDARVFVLHNADDFIVNQEQLDTLKSIFGERLRMNPHGGHLGNLWSPEVLDFILRTLKP